MKVHPKATSKKARDDAAAHERLAQLGQQAADQTAGSNDPEYVRPTVAKPKAEKT